MPMRVDAHEEQTWIIFAVLRGEITTTETAPAAVGPTCECEAGRQIS